jgi:uncharacterized membrane protein YeiH
MLVADAIGLGAYCMAGAQIAERAGLPAISCVLLGTITGSAGGAVRDVLSAEIPLVLRRGNLYASAAIAGIAVYFLAERAGLTHGLASGLGIGVVIAVRFASIWWGLQLPVFELKTTAERERPR